MNMLLLAAATLCTAGAAHASITSVPMSLTSQGSLFRYSSLGAPAGDQGVRRAHPAFG